MDPIILSDVPYVIAFVAVAILLFWLMGRLGERGLPEGPWRALVMALVCLYFVYVAVRNLADHNWLAASFAALMSIIAVLAVWSAWRRARLSRKRA